MKRETIRWMRITVSDRENRQPNLRLPYSGRSQMKGGAGVLVTDERGQCVRMQWKKGVKGDETSFERTPTTDWCGLRRPGITARIKSRPVNVVGRSESDGRPSESGTKVAGNVLALCATGRRLGRRNRLRMLRPGWIPANFFTGHLHRRWSRRSQNRTEPNTGAQGGRRAKGRRLDCGSWRCVKSGHPLDHPNRHAMNKCKRETNKSKRSNAPRC